MGLIIPPGAPVLPILQAMAVQLKPIIIGTPVIVGLGTGVLTVSANYLLAPTSAAYQWFRDGTAISGATSQSYAYVSADQGHSLTCQVTPTNGNGTSPAVLSAPVSVPVDFQMIVGYRTATPNLSVALYPSTTAGQSNTRRRIPIARSIPYSALRNVRPILTGWHQKNVSPFEENMVAGGTSHSAIERGFGDGSPVEVKWGGSSTLTHTPGATFTGDAVSGPFTQQDLGWRSWQSWPAGTKFSGSHPISSALGEGVAGAVTVADQSLVAGTPAAPALNNNYGYGPVAVIGTVDGTLRGQVGHSIGIVGDSIARGAGDNPGGFVDGGDQTTGVAGWVERAIGVNHGVANLAEFGNSFTGFNGNLGNNRVMNIVGLQDAASNYLIDRIICELGTNEPATNAATLIGNMVTAWNGIRARNATAKIAQTTLTPQVGKLDSSQPYTPANQNNASQGSGRFAPGASVDGTNLWLRDGAPLNVSGASPTQAAIGSTGASIARVGDSRHPISLILDINAMACTGPSTMIWKDGYLYDANNAGDGIHPCATGHIALAAAVQADAGWQAWIAGSFMSPNLPPAISYTADSTGFTADSTAFTADRTI